MAWTIDGGLVKEHLAVNFFGVEFAGQDVSGMTHLHIDVWTPEERDFGPNVDWLSVRFVDSMTRFEYLVTILSPFANVTAPNPTQISALLWMSTEDQIDWNALSDREIIERYSLATFYYATEGDLWSNTNNEWLSAFETDYSHSLFATSL